MKDSGINTEIHFSRETNVFGGCWSLYYKLKTWLNDLMVPDLVSLLLISSDILTSLVDRRKVITDIILHIISNKTSLHGSKFSMYAARTGHTVYLLLILLHDTFVYSTETYKSLNKIDSKINSSFLFYALFFVFLLLRRVPCTQ